MLLKALILLALPLLWATSDASPLSREKILEMLHTGRTLGGMHDTLGGDQVDGYTDVADSCAVSPVIWSGDFGFSVSRDDMVDDIAQRDRQLKKMIDLGKRGKIITLSWHQCNPAEGEPCTFKNGVQTPLTDQQWTDILTAGTPLRRGWEKQITPLAEVVKALKRRGITVLLRPYHEMNQPGMWWANEDPQKSIRLFRDFHDRLSNGYGLTNIIWVWSVAYHPNYWSNWKKYYPGSRYVDIIGLDVYPPNKGADPDFNDLYDQIARFAPGKVVALTEVSRLPSRDVKHLSHFSYVVPWGMNMLRRDNSESEVCDFYRDK